MWADFLRAGEVLEHRSRKFDIATHEERLLGEAWLIAHDAARDNHEL